MNLTRNKIFSGILIFWLITSILVLLDIQFLYFRAIFSFIFLITIPGLLIMLMLKIRKIGFWEYLVYTIGLSITFLMFGGLFINGTLPLIGINKPLSLIPLIISLDIFLIIFWLIAYNRNKEISFDIKLQELDGLNKIFLIIPIIFPILSIFGAIILNNHGPNYVTMFMLGGIAAYVFTIVLFRKKLNHNIYPWAILMLSISLLLMYSLRSWHILGWDIHQEYLVFTLTNSAKYWSPYASGGAYNSCISISILPTIFASFIKINNEYIYKIIFPILFSIVPLMIYLSTKKFLSEGYAFLTSFFFISQYWFIAQMPALARQEMAFIFLALIYLLIFNHELNKSIKSFLYIILGMSMILSHYSTTYVWLATMVIFYILGRLLKIIFLKNLKLFFSFKYILLMILVTFLWQFQLNVPPNDFGSVLSTTIYDISNIFSEDSITSGFNRLTFKNLNINNDQNVSNNYLTMTREYKNKALILYPESTYRDYSPRVVFSEKLKSKVPIGISIRAVFPEKLKSQVPIEMSIDVFNLLKVIRLILIVILPIIGIFHLFKKHFYKKNKNRDISNLKNSIGNYILISISILPLIVLFLFLPSVQTQYNLTRMYLQGLLSFSFLTVLGGHYLLYELRLNKISYFILGLTLILFFLSSTGLVSHLIGGNPLLPLNNFGEEYDMFYTTQLDVKSAEWLANKREGNSMIYADEVAGLRLTSSAYIIDYTFDILPSTIDTSSYVYLSQTNVEKGKVYKRYNIDFLEYDTPIEFLNSNKNLIYNNGGSEVFKSGNNRATYFDYTIQWELPPVVWPEGGTLTVAYEDLPLDRDNDWDYDDFMVDIDTVAMFFGASEEDNEYITQIKFTVHPQAKLAEYTHRMHLFVDTFERDGTYELYRNGSLVESGNYDDGTGLDVVLVPNTGSYPYSVELIIFFDGGCAFSFPEWDENFYYGENLFFDPYLHVNNTGEDIHTGDVRMLTVPIDGYGQRQDGNAIWDVYPKVTSGNPPTFQPNWWIKPM